MIITMRLTDAIEFHDAFHGFRGGRGTGTATIELKLVENQIMKVREEQVMIHPEYILRKL
jgi:hypothetical protein